MRGPDTVILRVNRSTLFCISVIDCNERSVTSVWALKSSNSQPPANPTRRKAAGGWNLGDREALDGAVASVTAKVDGVDHGSERSLERARITQMI